jgi:hypothetical protein
MDIGSSVGGGSTMNNMTRYLLFLGAGCMPYVIPDERPIDSGNFHSGGPFSDSAQTAIIATLADDYSLGALATISVNGLGVQDTLAPISGDAVVRTSQDKVVVLNRLNADTMRVYETSWDSPALDIALEDLSNPQDAAICGGNLYVSVHNGSHIPAYDVGTGLLVDNVDLSPWAGTDGSAEAATMVTDGAHLFVAVQQLKQDAGWVSDGGAILRADCTTGTLEQWAESAPSPVITEGINGETIGYKTGLFGAIDGEIGLFQRANAEKTVLVEEVQLGADIHAFAFSTSHLVYATADRDWNFQVHCLDLDTGVTAHSDTTSSYISDIAMDELGRAWVSRRLGWSDSVPDATGIDILTPAGCVSVFNDEALLPLSLAPFNVAFR